MNENSMMQPVWVVYDLAPAHHEGAIRDKLIEMGWTPPSAEPARPVEASGALAATTFICHLIDNHEGEKVTEESLQSWLTEALAHPRPTVEQAGEAAMGDYAKQIRGSIIRRLEGFHESNPSSWCGYLDDAMGAAEVIAESMEKANSRTAGVPDGYKIVPVKAMREITEAGRKSLIESSKANVTYDTTAAYAYEEMVAAAPTPGKGGEA